MRVMHGFLPARDQRERIRCHLFRTCELRELLVKTAYSVVSSIKTQLRERIFFSYSRSDFCSRN